MLILLSTMILFTADDNNDEL